MKQILFFLVIFLICYNELHGQQDSLLVSDTSEQIKNAPINPVVISYKPDTAFLREFPWGNPPPCIVPFKWDTIHWSSQFFLPSNIVYVFSYNAKAAREDLKNGKARILFSSGFGGTPDFSSKKDKEFQTKYHVEFFSQGCFHGGGNENEEAYNQVIFGYLDKKFGNAWRFELRTDAIGFEVPELVIPELGSLATQIANSVNPLKTESMNLDPETSIWWYILPTSGFALLLSLYFIKRKKD